MEVRLDGDLYTSTIQVMDLLYDRVSLGGFIYVDDYAAAGCRKAVTEFRAKRNITTPIVKVYEFAAGWGPNATRYQ